MEESDEDLIRKIALLQKRLERRKENAKLMAPSFARRLPIRLNCPISIRGVKLYLDPSVN